MAIKILQLTKKFPYPLKDGECIAITNLAKALDVLGCELTLLSMNTSKHFTPIKQVPAHFNHYKNIYTVNVDNKLRPLDALKYLWAGRSYHIARFDHDGFRKKLIQLLKREEFDIIQLETSYLAPYIYDIRKHSDAVIALRTHNVEYEIWQRVADNCKSGLRKMYLQKLVEQLREYEIEMVNACDMLVPISKRDLQHFQRTGYNGDTCVIPIGLDTQRYLPQRHYMSPQPSIGFIGSLDWMPNREGLLWFLENVWTKLPESMSHMQLHIAGRNMPSVFYNGKWKNAIFHGEVPDAKSFINAHPFMIVPLHSGSGMRVKILEGMALEKTVITTSLGLEGIDAEIGDEVLLADRVDTFLECLKYAVRNQHEMRKIGVRARERVLSDYDNVVVARKLQAAYRSYLVEQRI